MIKNNKKNMLRKKKKKKPNNKYPLIIFDYFSVFAKMILSKN